MQRLFRLAAAGALPLALAACSSSGAPPNVNAPTAQAAATQVAPTAQAAATRIAPTVQAAATAVAPTVQAAATQAAPAAATAQAAAPVRITAARVTTGDAMLTVEGTGSQPVDLSGWTLGVGGTGVRLPANTAVRPGEALVIHTASGTSSGSDVYLGQAAQSLVQSLRPGARVSLSNPSGTEVTAFTIPSA
jgi:hypothetical protein